MKFIHIVKSVRAHPDYAEKYAANPDSHTSGLAFEKMLREVMLKHRKEELELYKLFASDKAFHAAWSKSVEQALSRVPRGKEDPEVT